MREYTFDEIVVLITMDETTGEETRSRSYASIASVRGSETYQAMTVGLKPELMIVLPDGDNPYRVLRAYQTEDGRAELTVYRLRPGVSEANSFL